MRPFTVCLFQESKILASATSGFGQKKKFTLRTAGAEGNVVLWIGKDVVLAGFIPVLVFDRVALQFREGISSRGFSEGIDAFLSCMLSGFFLIVRVVLCGDNRRNVARVVRVVLCRIAIYSC